MKRSLTFVFALVSLCAKSQLTTAVEPIIHNQAYCVHSLLYLNGNIINTSNIYVIKGTADTVWIFGCGYGDTTDLNIYRDTSLVTSLHQDLRSVDSIVGLFGMGTIKPMVLVPHFHLDHINSEFINGIDSLFGFMNSYIYIHIADKSRCTCGSICCGSLPCNPSSSYFGAPFDKAWSQPMLTRFKSLGNKNNSCGFNLKYITTIYGGWKITKASPIHTGGCINMDCDSLKIRISGSDVNGTCTPPGGWDNLPIHGNCNVDSVYSM